MIEQDKIPERVYCFWLKLTLNVLSVSRFSFDRNSFWLRQGSQWGDTLIVTLTILFLQLTFLWK